MASHSCPQAEVLERLAAVLSAQPDILVATLFGSVVQGTARPDSDVDVGVFANAPLTPRRKQQLIARLAEVSGCPVDLVDLRDAGPVVLRSALNGLRLVGKGSAANAALLSRAVTDAADFLPARERILRQRREAWTKVILAEKLEALRRCVRCIDAPRTDAAMTDSDAVRFLLTSVTGEGGLPAR